MVAVDTNLVVRLVTNDHAAQAARAAAIFRAGPVFVAKSVLLETAWVLQYTYGLELTVVAAALRRVLGLPNVTTDDPTAVATAFGLFEQGLDFVDAVHLASSASVERFVTFDARFAKRAAVVSPVPISLA